MRNVSSDIGLGDLEVAENKMGIRRLLYGSLIPYLFIYFFFFSYSVVWTVISIVVIVVIVIGGCICKAIN